MIFIRTIHGKNLETRIDKATVVAIDKNDTQFYVRLAVKDEAYWKPLQRHLKQRILIFETSFKSSGGHAQVVILTDVTNEGV